MAQENNTINSGAIVPWQLDPGTLHDDVSLFTWWRTRLGFNCISVPDRDLDLYGDLVARHQSDEFLALTFTIAGKPIEVTYQKLHDEVVMLHRRWAQVLLQPGKTLAIAAMAVFLPTARRKRRRSLSCGNKALTKLASRNWRL